MNKENMSRFRHPDDGILNHEHLTAIGEYLERMKQWANRSEFLAPNSEVSLLEVQSFVNEVDRLTPHAMWAMLSDKREGEILASEDPRGSVLFDLFWRCMELRKYSAQMGKILARETVV